MFSESDVKATKRPSALIEGLLLDADGSAVVALVAYPNRFTLTTSVFTPDKATSS